MDFAGRFAAIGCSPQNTFEEDFQVRSLGHIHVAISQKLSAMIEYIIADRIASLPIPLGMNICNRISGDAFYRNDSFSNDQ